MTIIYRIVDLWKRLKYWYKEPQVSSEWSHEWKNKIHRGY